MDTDSCLGISDEPYYKVDILRRIIRFLAVRMKRTDIIGATSDLFRIRHSYIAVIYIQIPVRQGAAAYERHLCRLRDLKVRAVDIILDIFIRIDVACLYRNRAVRIGGSAVLGRVEGIYRLILLVSRYIEVCIVRGDIHPLVVQRFDLYLKRCFHRVRLSPVLIDLSLDLRAPEHIVFIFIERFDLQIHGSGIIGVYGATVIIVIHLVYPEDRLFDRIERTDIPEVCR